MTKFIMHGNLSNYTVGTTHTFLIDGVGPCAGIVRNVVTIKEYLEQEYPENFYPHSNPGPDFVEIELLD